MRKMLKNAIALLLIGVLLLAAGCQGGYFTTRRAAFIDALHATPTATSHEDSTPLGTPGQETPRQEETPGATDTPALRQVGPIVYTAPDLDTLSAALKSLQKAIDRGSKELSALMDDYAAVLQMYDEADTACQIAYLLYAKDVTVDTYWDEYARIQEELLSLDLDMTDVSVALFRISDEAEQLARDRFGDGYVDTVYAEEKLSSEAVVDLLVADNDLQAEYDRLLTTFSFTDDGREWTLDDILGDDSLEYDRYIDLYARYCAQFNKEAGALFIEMLALRAEVAAKLGYGSFAAYRYDCYGRDYTITEAQTFHALVKQYIVPLFLSANANALPVYSLYYADYDEQEFMDSFAESIESNETASEALDFMLDNELYDFEVSARKMESSFTTYISSMRAPYIFTQWEDDSASIGTVLHEFGHFMNYYYNADVGWSSGDSLDLAEVDSQAFVLLMWPHYDDLFGKKMGSLAETDQLLDALYAIVTGSMEDEFQQRVYANPNMTLREMNALYAQLSKEYGMSEVYGLTGTEWVLIPHTFQSPMYYISYATSMVLSLELWQIQREQGESAAWDAYMEILMREPYAGLRAVTGSNAALGYPLLPSTISYIASVLNRYLPAA